REGRTPPAPRQVEGRARPLAVALAQERQIEQPFAGIIEDLEGDFGSAAGGTPDRVAAAEEPPRREAQRQAHPPQIGRTRRPMWRVSGECRDRLIQRERWYGIVLWREQPYAENAAIRGRSQEGKAGRLAYGAEQVVN